MCSFCPRHRSNQSASVPVVFIWVFHRGGVTTQYPCKDIGIESFIWVVSSVYWGMANDGYNSRAVVEGILVGEKNIYSGGRIIPGQ